MKRITPGTGRFVSSAAILTVAAIAVKPDSPPQRMIGAIPMERFKFWQRGKQAPSSEEPPVIKRFNIQPRTDTSPVGSPADPDQATRLAALRRQREAVLSEVAAAEAALAENNRWRAEIELIEQAIAETDEDLAALDHRSAPAGRQLPATPVSDLSVEVEPVARVRFRIGDEQFDYVEEIDWAERGTQIARSELIRQSGDPAALVTDPPDSAERDRLADHLERSLFVFATDLRDRALAGEQLPAATLSDLARPSAEFGAWLDWSGNSPIRQRIEIERNRLEAERARLAGERQALIEDQEKMVELVPIARRRLLELDRIIDAITAGT
jgi:hypothetical protein